MKVRSGLILLALAAAGQQPQPSVVFRSSSNLVVVDVSVRDRDGKPVEGLKKEQFVVLEDGKPQTISVFEYQRLAGETPPPAQPSVPVRTETPRTKIAIAAPAKVQYQDRRLLVLFFDFSSMAVAEQIRAQEAALKFLEKQMTASDLVAIMTFSTRLRVEQDFTDDRETLAGIIRGFRIGEMSELAAEADTADENSGEDTGAAFIADETEFNIFNTDRKLSALESAAKQLVALPEKKALVYFSSGVGKTGVENQSQLRSTINAAVRANVAFYPIDARGLMALPPGGDASKAAPRGSGIFSGQAQRQQKERFNDQQETLSTLAADTGGKAFLDSNELSLGIVQAQKDVDSYYILGYYSTNDAQDGRYRRIQIKTPEQPRARLEYRTGYFGPKHFGAFTADDKERQLEEALMLGDPVTDLPLALEVDYFRLTNNRYFVPVSLKIPGSQVPLARKGSNEVTELDFIAHVVDAKGKVAGTVRDAIRVKLKEPEAAQAGQRHFQYDTGFTLAPGAYRLKFLARENQTGKMGTFETRFTIPDLGSEQRSLRLSSVVWGSQREALAAAVGSAGEKKKLLETNPLVAGGRKLVPSITKVFRKNQTLYVYFEVYDPSVDETEKTPSVAATLSFFQGSAKAFESEPVKLTRLSPSRHQALPVQFQVPLAQLPPGRYICQVNVVDESGRKFAFPRAPLVLLP